MNADKKKFLLDIINKHMSNKSILLIDDEEEIKSLMANYLLRTQIEAKNIVMASNGKEALAKIQNQEFGLIILDLIMPKMTGLQLIKELKLRTYSKDIPILIVSGVVETESVKTAIALGINNIIVKPFTYSMFLEKIGQTLRI